MQHAPNKKRESGALAEVWRAHNAMVDYVRAIAVQQSGSQGVRVSQTANGTLLKVESIESTAGSAVKMFRVKSVQDDYLTCREYDGTNEGSSDVLIAKPFDLRVTGWNGITIVHSVESSGGTRSVTYTKLSSVYRRATSGSTTEFQAIRPQYIVNRSVVFATKSSNGTGVSDASEWVDMNADGRAFAKLS